MKEDVANSVANLNTKIGAIRELPAQVRKATKGLNDSQLDTAYREGGWTVRQVVHHIADSHMNAFIRFKLALTEDHPTVKPYDQDEWALLSDSRSSIAPSLAIIDGMHERWADLLDHATQSDWSRTINHPERGTLTASDLLDSYAEHGRNHVAQITELRERKNW